MAVGLTRQKLQEEQLEGLTNEDVLQAIWRINSLQRSLSIMALTWASCLHDAAAATFPGKLRPGVAINASMQVRPSAAPTGSLLQVRCLLFDRAVSQPGPYQRVCGAHVRA